MHKTFFRSLIVAIAASSLAVCDSKAQIIRLDAGGGGGFSRSVSVTEQDGVKTTNVTENGKKYLLREGDDFVEIQYAKTYGPKDLDKLKKDQPALYMHATSFPKTSGDSKVELTISVQEVAKAETLDELEEKNAYAYKLFNRFSKHGGIPAMGFGGGRIEIGGGIIEFGDIARDLQGVEADAGKRIKEVEKRANEMRERLLKKSKELREKAKKGTEEKVEPKKNKKKVLIDA